MIFFELIVFLLPLNTNKINFVCKHHKFYIKIKVRNKSWFFGNFHQNNIDNQKFAYIILKIILKNYDILPSSLHSSILLFVCEIIIITPII